MFHKNKIIRFIDLFAGMGGTRLGFEQACTELGFKSKCVFTSEIKDHAIKIYTKNFGMDNIDGDITKIHEKDIPDFDVLLAGFPCQAFSSAGKRLGFNDTRGTLFFDIARIIKEKKPSAFLLENVEGLVKHDLKNPKDKIGRTLSTILDVLNQLGYYVDWKVLNASDFGIPQERKRIYLIGSKEEEIIIPEFNKVKYPLKTILQKNKKPLETEFTKKLLTLYDPSYLIGKAIKDRRGGDNNIHSWDLETKGPISKKQKEILNTLLKVRRRKKWATLKNMKWMDGIPLTVSDIHMFFPAIKKSELKKMLNDLKIKGYLTYEHPKNLIKLSNNRMERIEDKDIEKGYNLVTGKLSFELSVILHPDKTCPTIVATDANRIAVIDNKKLRRLTDRECLRLFGFPNSYKNNISMRELYDLVGNSIVVPIVQQLTKVILEKKDKKNIKKNSEKNILQEEAKQLHFL